MALNATFIANFDSFTSAVAKAEASLKGFEEGSAKVGAALDRMGNSFSGQKLISEATLMVRAVENIGGVTKLTTQEFDRLTATVGPAVAKMKALGIEVPPEMQKLVGATSNVAIGMSAAGKSASASGQMITGMSQSGALASGSMNKLGIDAHKLDQLTGGLSTRMAALAGPAAIGAVVTGLIAFTKSAFTTADQLQKMSDRTGISVENLQRLTVVAKASGNTVEQMAGAMGILQRNIGDGPVDQIDRHFS